MHRIVRVLDSEQEKQQETIFSFQALGMLHPDAATCLTFQALRTRMSQLPYVGIIPYERQYNRMVEELEAQYQKRVRGAAASQKGVQRWKPVVAEMSGGKINLPKLGDDFREVIQDALKKNARPGSGGWVVEYGKLNIDSLMSPLTTFTINPRIEELPTVLKILDACVRECNVQVKINMNAVCDLYENPSSKHPSFY